MFLYIKWIITNLIDRWECCPTALAVVKEVSYWNTSHDYLRDRRVCPERPDEPDRPKFPIEGVQCNRWNRPTKDDKDADKKSIPVCMIGLKNNFYALNIKTLHH